MFLGQARYRSIKRFKNLLRLSFLILITIIKRWIKRWMMQGISRYIRVTNIYCYLPSHQMVDISHTIIPYRFLSFPSFKQSSRFLRDKDLKWIIEMKILIAYFVSFLEFLILTFPPNLGSNSCMKSTTTSLMIVPAKSFKLQRAVAGVVQYLHIATTQARVFN